MCCTDTRPAVSSGCPEASTSRCINRSTSTSDGGSLLISRNRPSRHDQTKTDDCEERSGSEAGWRCACSPIGSRPPSLRQATRYHLRCIRCPRGSAARTGRARKADGRVPPSSGFPHEGRRFAVGGERRPCCDSLGRSVRSCDQDADEMRRLRRLLSSSSETRVSMGSPGMHSMVTTKVVAPSARLLASW